MRGASRVSDSPPFFSVNLPLLEIIGGKITLQKIIISRRSQEASEVVQAEQVGEVLYIQVVSPF